MLFSNPLETIESLDELCLQLNNDDLFNLVSQKNTPSPFIPAIINEDEKFIRYLVLEVYMDDQNQYKKIVRLLRETDDGDSFEAFLHLQDDWCATAVIPGAYVNLILGKLTTPPSISTPLTLTNSSEEMLILHPDHLVSITTVADSFSCVRRTVLKQKFKKPLLDMTPALIYGSILHEVFQISLKKLDFTDSFIRKEIDRAVKDNLDGLYLALISTANAVAHLGEFIVIMQQWANKHLVNMEFKGQSRRTNINKNDLSIVNIKTIEERFWSPMFGLKGNVDISVNLKGKKNQVIPMEIKTGKNSGSVQHRAQTTLYSLLMTDRYRTDLPIGVLCYLKTAEMIEIPNIHNEIRGLLCNRNNLVQYLADDSKLPGMLGQQHACNMCQINSECLVYHKSMENGTAQSSGIPALFSSVTDNLSAIHCDFLKTWDEMISMEEGDVNRFRKEIWTMDSQKREKLGRCFSNMELVYFKQSKDNIAGMSNFVYQFKRSTKTSSPTITQKSLLESEISVGEPVVVSEEGKNGALAVASGFVKDVSPDSITIVADKKLKYLEEEGIKDGHIGVDENFDGISATAGGSGLFCGRNRSSSKVVLHRIDKDEFQNGMGMVRDNLLYMFTDAGDTLRKRVVDLNEPLFFSKIDIPDVVDTTMNSDQINAIGMVFRAKDYALILGMPGTGKTTTITKIVHHLSSQNKSVLLTSYTHSAVDNILLKLAENNIPFLRLGSNLDKIHKYTPNYSKTINTVEDLSRYYNSFNIVATTCLGIKQKFDYCIVDEASQITLPVCLGPLRFADKFILVGDHYQLPPLVRDVVAKDNGYDISLFKRLSEAHPEAIVYLEHQYRMNAEILMLCNDLIYSHRLRCGNLEVAESRFCIPKFRSGMVEAHDVGLGGMCRDLNCWLVKVIDPEVPIVFLNTDTASAAESRVGPNVQNKTEGLVVELIVKSLMMSGVCGTRLGVISPYRSQLKLINQLLLNCLDVEASTVDKYQGRDKDCIIISLVRSNAENTIGELLRDWRRINVAFTRAKTKLIVIGSRSTLELSNTELFSQFFKIVGPNVVDLTFTFEEDHKLNFFGQKPVSQHSTPSNIKSWGNIKRTKVAKIAILKDLIQE